jgi:endonuclease III
MPTKASSSKPANPKLKQLKQKVLRVCENLDTAQGEIFWKSHGKPLEGLIQTILSQHTSDVNSERAFDNLRQVYPTWELVYNAPLADIIEAIKRGGLANTKAARIQSVLGQVYKDTGNYSLDFLEEKTTDEAMTYLGQFHGVGPKTIACVLMFCMGRPVLPVDTHVFRVSHRLGLIDAKIGEAKAHDALQAMVPDEKVYAFHVHLIRHGRLVCQAQQPKCEACCLSYLCDFYQKGITGGKG